MSDMISKQAAVSIPVLPKEYREYQTMNLDDAYELGWYDLQKCIEKMPSAEPDADMIHLQKEQAYMQGWEDAKTSAQPEIIRCKDCKHYYFADNRIPLEQRYTCALDGDRWKPDSFCSFAERKEE